LFVVAVFILEAVRGRRPPAVVQTVIKSARFVYSPYTATEMQGFAQVLADSIRSPIQSGQNIYDQAAAPLKPGLQGRRGYPDYKSARGLPPIRDWTWSGHTLRCLKVLTANENRAAIGFLDESLPGRPNDGFADRRLQQPARGAVGCLASRPPGGSRRIPGTSFPDTQGSVNGRPSRTP